MVIEKMWCCIYFNLYLPSLYAWIKRYDPQQPKITESNDPSAELAKLKKELQRVTEERDILKKAAVYFASQSK